MPISEQLPPSLTMPLSQQEQLPIGLAADWCDRPLDDQIQFLLDNGVLMRTETFVAAGLEAGANRLDQLNSAENEAVHKLSLQNVLGSEAVHAAFMTGNREYVKAGPQLGVKLNQEIDDESLNGRDLTVGYDEIVHVARLIKKRFGQEIINPVFIHSIFGHSSSLSLSPSSRRAKGQARLYLHRTLIAIEDAEWSLDLRAMAGLQYMHQAASGAARQSIAPLLGDMPPMTKPGMEQTAWQARLTRIAYPLGFRAKSGPALVAAMRQEWGEDYWRNRSIFTALLNMGEYKEDALVQTHIRRPACTSIAKGNFDKALEQLQAGLEDYPHVFSWISRRFLEAE